MQLTYLHVHVLLLSTDTIVILCDALVYMLKLLHQLWVVADLPSKINWILFIIYLLCFIRSIGCLSPQMILNLRYCGRNWFIIVWYCTVVISWKFWWNYWFRLIYSLNRFQNSLWSFCRWGYVSDCKVTKNSNLPSFQLTGVQAPEYISHLR